MKDDFDDVFNIDHLLREDKPKPEEAKFNYNSLLKGKIKKPQEQKEETDKEKEQSRLKKVYQVRLYLYTFKDCDNLFLALNVEQNDKKINKFIQDLYRRKEADLEKLLDFIKFHIRHNNNTVQGNFCTGVFFTITKILELFLLKVGIDVICDCFS